MSIQGSGHGLGDSLQKYQNASQAHKAATNEMSKLRKNIPNDGNISLIGRVKIQLLEPRLNAKIDKAAKALEEANQKVSENLKDHFGEYNEKGETTLTDKEIMGLMLYFKRESGGDPSNMTPEHIKFNKMIKADPIGSDRITRIEKQLKIVGKASVIAEEARGMKTVAFKAHLKKGTTEDTKAKAEAVENAEKGVNWSARQDKLTTAMANAHDKSQSPAIANAYNKSTWEKENNFQRAHSLIHKESRKEFESAGLLSRTLSVNRGSEKLDGARLTAEEMKAEKGAFAGFKRAVALKLGIANCYSDFKYMENKLRNGKIIDPEEIRTTLGRMEKILNFASRAVGEGDQNFFALRNEVQKLRAEFDAVDISEGREAGSVTGLAQRQAVEKKERQYVSEGSKHLATFLGQNVTRGEGRLSKHLDYLPGDTESFAGVLTKAASVIASIVTLGTFTRLVSHGQFEDKDGKKSMLTSDRRELLQIYAKAAKGKFKTVEELQKATDRAVVLLKKIETELNNIENDLKKRGLEPNAELARLKSNLDIALNGADLQDEEATNPSAGANSELSEDGDGLTSQKLYVPSDDDNTSRDNIESTPNKAVVAAKNANIIVNSSDHALGLRELRDLLDGQNSEINKMKVGPGISEQERDNVLKRPEEKYFDAETGGMNEEIPPLQGPGTYEEVFFDAVENQPEEGEPLAGSTASRGKTPPPESKLGELQGTDDKPLNTIFAKYGITTTTFTTAKEVNTLLDNLNGEIEPDDLPRLLDAVKNLIYNLKNVPLTEKNDLNAKLLEVGKSIMQSQFHVNIDDDLSKISEDIGKSSPNNSANLFAAVKALRDLMLGVLLPQATISPEEIEKKKVADAEKALKIEDMKNAMPAAILAHIKAILNRGSVQDNKEAVTRSGPEVKKFIQDNKAHIRTVIDELKQRAMSEDLMKIVLKAESEFEDMIKQ